MTNDNKSPLTSNKSGNYNDRGAKTPTYTPSPVPKTTSKSNPKK